VHRQLQRALASEIRLGGWDVLVPELYADEVTDDRTPERDRPELRTWTAESVGVTRLPVGLVRFVESDPQLRPGLDALPCGWELRGRNITIWPNGVGVVELAFFTERHEDLDLGAARAEWDARRAALSEDVLAVAALTSGALLRSEVAGVETGRAHGAIVSSRHPIWSIDAEPTEELRRRVRDQLVLIGRGAEFVDICADEHRFCYPGNGSSVEVASRSRYGQSLLAPVTRYYQYWVVATTAMDDRLHREFVRITDLEYDDRPGAGFAVLRRSDPAHEVEGERLKDAARELFFDHRDVLTAMAPKHLAAWNGYVETWRIPQLQADVQDKLVAIEDVARRIREEASNSIARKTTAVVTFLTALTLVSITTGIAAFLLREDRLSTPIRVWLVVISALMAILLFVLSIRPRLVQAEQRRRSFEPERA
jgi:hypothetical protein